MPHADDRSAVTRSGTLVLLAVATLVAIALRFFNLGGFAYQGDEFSTYAQTVGPIELERSFPLLFLAGKAITGVLEVSEFSMRLLPATLGVLSIPLFYFAGRKVYGELPMALAGLFIALNHWHLFHSQSARFYTAVFLFSGVAICLLSTTLTTRKVLPAFLASVCVCVGAGFHPTAVWPAIAFTVYCLLGLVAPTVRQTLSVRVLLAFYVPLALAAIGVFLQAISTVVSFNSSLGRLWGYSPSHLAMGWVRGLELPVFVLAGCWLLGVLLKDRAKGYYLALTGFLPLGLLALLTSFTPVRQDYAFATAPIWFILAGSAAAAVLSSTSIPTFARAGFILALCACFLPSTISHHSANLTCDPRLAFSYLKDHATKDDQIYYTFVPMLQHYTGLEAQIIQCTEESQNGRLKEIESSEKTSWFLVAASRFGIPEQMLAKWLNDHARLEARFDARRFDYEVKTLMIYKYVPRTKPPSGSSSEVGGE